MPRPATSSLRVPRVRALQAGGAGLAAVTAAVLLTGCQTQSPYQTQEPYQPADGVNTSIGSLQARGLVLVAASQGATGVLVGSFINQGTQPLTVTVLTAAQASAGTTTGPQQQLSGSQQADVSGIQISDVPAPPGALATLVLQTSAGQTQIQVPVLPAIGYYATSTPTGATTTPTSGTSSTGPASSVTVATSTTTAAG